MNASTLSTRISIALLYNQSLKQVSMRILFISQYNDHRAAVNCFFLSVDCEDDEDLIYTSASERGPFKICGCYVTYCTHEQNYNCESR